MGPHLLQRQDLEALLGRTPGTLVLVEAYGEFSQIDFQHSESALEKVLETLCLHLPSEASLARHGGRIVAVWLPNLDSEHAHETVRRGLRIESPSPLMGAVSCTEQEDPAVLIDRADRSLSRAREEPSWASWDPKQDQGRRRADPLAGIFSSQPARTYRNVRYLLDTIQSISSPQTLEQILSTALSRTIQVAGADRGLLLLKQEAGGFETAIAQNREGDPIELTDDRSQSIPHRVLKDGVSVCLTRTEEIAQTEVRPGSLDQHRLRTVVCVPLECSEERIGVLYVDGRVHRNMVGSEELAFLEAIARQLAMAIESKRVADNSRLRLEQEVTRLRSTTGSWRLIGDHPSMSALFKQITRIAPRSFHVLITGPTGSGKETIARALHTASPRADGPFQILDCSTLPESLIESELFGHEEGAFTGAHQSHIGIFEQASGGTLLIDQITSLSRSAQAHLLRVLETQEIRRMGGSDTQKIDVRIVATTSQDMEQEIQAEQFREALLYRISGICLKIPPLSTRGDDVLLLASHFLDLFGETRSLSKEAQQALLIHDWPGNVRELRQRLLRASTLSREPVLTISDLGLKLDIPSGEDLALARTRARQTVDRDFLLRALAKNEGRIVEAAQDLGLTRARIYQMMKELDVDPDPFRP